MLPGLRPFFLFWAGMMPGPGPGPLGPKALGRISLLPYPFQGPFGALVGPLGPFQLVQDPLRLFRPGMLTTVREGSLVLAQT